MRASLFYNIPCPICSSRLCSNTYVLTGAFQNQLYLDFCMLGVFPFSSRPPPNLLQPCYVPHRVALYELNHLGSLIPWFLVAFDKWEALEGGGRKRKSLRYLFPLIPFLLGHWLAVASFLHSYLLQLSSLKVPETTPSLAPSCLRMIKALSSKVFHQPLLVMFTLLSFVIIPASPQSHCWSVPGDN